MDDANELPQQMAKRRSGSERPGSPVDAHRLKRAVLDGRRWLIGAALFGLIVGFACVKLLMSSAYEATAVLKYEGDLQVAGLPQTRDALAPAAGALMRQSVLRKIAEETNYEGSLTSLKRALGYEIDMMSGTIAITVAAYTAEGAAELARTVTDIFLDYHKERQSRRFEDEIARTRKRIDASEHEGEVARRRYNEFREANGIADLSTEQQSMVRSAAKLRADSELAVSEVRALEAEVKALEEQLAQTPKTSALPGGASPERAAYNRLRQELASAKATLSPEHPQVQALQQQVDQLHAQLRAGGGASLGGAGLFGVNASYERLESQLRAAKAKVEARRERQKGLAEMADKAQHRVEAFSDIEGEASALLAEVKVNENLVSGLRRTEAALEDALRDPPSGFVVIDPGAVPEYPVRNKMKTVVFGLIIASSFGFALFVVLRREFKGLRVKTPVEVAFWGQGPVVAATAWPNDPMGLDELVGSLDDCVPGARGNFLIVGGSEHESGLARELADRMNEDWSATSPSTEAPSPWRTRPAPEVPIQTPPPSGPYPIGHSTAKGVALAQRPVSYPLETIPRPKRSADQLELEAWDGPLDGQALRRAARLSKRVLVLIRSGTMSALSLNAIRTRIGRQDGIGYIVVGLGDAWCSLPDRTGDVAAFWQS